MSGGDWVVVELVPTMLVGGAGHGGKVLWYGDGGSSSSRRGHSRVNNLRIVNVILRKIS